MLALGIERYTAITMIVIGLSHVLQPAMWCHWFCKLAEAKVAAVAIAMVSLPFGLILVLTHNDWTLRPTIIVTILGWGQVVKASLYLLFPPSLSAKAWKWRVAKPG